MSWVQVNLTLSLEINDSVDAHILGIFSFVVVINGEHAWDTNANKKMLIVNSRLLHDTLTTVLSFLIFNTLKASNKNVFSREFFQFYV